MSEDDNFEDEINENEEHDESDDSQSDSNTSNDNYTMTPGIIKSLDFSKGLSDQFLVYANEVIGYRALPDIRDGLKPVHRRILYGMYANEYKSNDKPKKSAQIVGKVMGEFHPHGDASIYSAMVRMAQPFSMNVKYIEGSGNWGSRDGLPAAAMRYTECRMTQFAEEAFFEGIKKDVIDFLPTYDGQGKEPLVLPIVVPTILLNSLSGIAVGLATDILPHNLGEVVDCLVRYLDNPNLPEGDIIGNLAPDFATGCNVAYDRESLHELYKTGQSKPIRCRGVYHTEGDSIIVFTQIPYQISKKDLIEHIADLCDQKIIENIVDVRDESTSQVRFVIEINSKTNTDVVVSQLFKYTALENSYKANFTCLINGTPTVVSLKRILDEFIKFRIESIKREITFDLNQAEATLHIREGLKIVHDHLDRVIQIIRNSSGDDESRPTLMSEFNLSEKQADSILAMRLGNISRIQGHKVDAEILELKAKIGDLKSFLEDQPRIIAKIKAMALAVKEKYNTPRRSVLVGDFTETAILDLIVEEDVVLLFTSDGNLKVTRISDYRTQKRGGQGSYGANTEKDVYTKFIVRSNTKDTLLMFTNKGNCFWLMAYQIPLTNKNSKPTNLKGFLNPLIDGGLAEDETVVACLSIREFDDNRNIVILSSKGLMKRLKLGWFERFRKKAYSVYPCKETEADVLEVKLVNSDSNLMMFSKNGMALRFHTKKIREMENRSAMGVQTMRLKEDDKVIGFDYVDETHLILHITENGFGKITPVSEFNVKETRTAGGVAYCKITEETGPVINALPVTMVGDILVMTSNSKTVRVDVSSIRECGRTAKGVIIQKMVPGESVVATAFIPSIEEDEAEVLATTASSSSEASQQNELETNETSSNANENEPLIDTSNLGEAGEDNDGHDIISDLDNEDGNE